MRHWPPLPRGVGILAGGSAGLLVGLADGVRAAWAFGTGAKAGLATAALVGGVDMLAGLVAGGLFELVLRTAIWGRRGQVPVWARVVSLAAAGLGAGGAAAGTVIATSLRNNRFLAAGLTVLAAIAATVAGIALAPAVARLIAAGRARLTSPTGAGPADLLLAPLGVAVVAAAVGFPIARMRAPLVGSVLAGKAVGAAVAAAAMPLAIVLSGRLRLPWSARRAAVAAAAIYGTLLAAGLAAAWNDHLRFAPWTDMLAGAAVAVGAAVLAFGFGWRVPVGRAALTAAAGLMVAALALTVTAAESEPARKAATARAGLVGSVLETARGLLDVDHDGFARALGGGDCDDRDPDVHPGAVDLPGDGLDADCDGQDASEALPPAARMFDLPASVPADLDLLLITVDTLRADHLGCYGYGRATSPVIDALASAGALFENGWAHAPSTRYSMPAIAAGRWPSAITWDESIWWPRLGPFMRTTAQVLHDAGYFTGGMFSFSYFAIADRRGFERGMDIYRADRAVLHVAVNGPMESHGSSSREITDDAIAFLDENKGRKFFLWLHYYDPHLSYEAHAEVPPFGSSRIDGYDGEIRFTDLHLGRLFDRLRALGLWDRTAIVLTGDHGEGFGEHGVTEHGFDLYPAQTKVPFIVRVPGLPPRRVRAPAGHVDIAPTLLNLARGATTLASSPFFGRSLVPDLAGGPAPDTETRAVFQEVTSERGKKRALVTAARHLIWNAVPGDTTECYDRAADPAEAHDIWRGAGGDPACVALSHDLKRLVAGLALPAGAATKLALAVTPPGAKPPAPGQSLAAALGDAIEIEGYDLAPAQPRPGNTVDVTVHFAVKQRLPPGWRLFFHIDGPGGFRNLDHVPVDGLMPLERWRPGQRIRDRQTIAMPPGSPPGTYTVYIGAYRLAQRLKVSPATASDAQDRLRLLTFTVAQ